ncbi:MAG: hypothetical protein IT438_08960 [Phycisphaerales bacterium]|nr:hypothetical protein [Phycisphaerales bacterium]
MTCGSSVERLTAHHLVRRVLGHGLVFAAVLALTVGVGGCSRKKKYSQRSPDELIASAVQMIKDGKTTQLPDLIYADSPEMRVVLNNMGKLAGHMQSMSAAAAERFPDELAKLKDKAAESAADGSAVEFLNKMMSGGGPGGGGRGGRVSVRVGSGGVSASPSGGGPMDERQMEDLFNRLFADPYGWLERNASRLSTIKTADDTASIMLDGEPIIPGLGLPMKLEEGRWYIALPTNMPGASSFWPRSKDQWSILNSLVTVLDKTVVDMEHDIRSGQTATLSSLGTDARKKVILPGAIAFAAYGKEVDVRMRVDRRVKQVQAKNKEWTRMKEEAGVEVPARLLSTIARLAPDEIEPLVRQNKAPNIERLTLREYEELAGAWLSKAGIGVRLDGELSKDVVEAEVKKWEESRKKAVAAKK